MNNALICLSLLLIFCALPISSLAIESNAPDEKLAMLAALNFLDLADQGEFAQCWESASQLFREKIDKQQWIDDINHLRSQYGASKNRSLQFTNPVEPSPETGNLATLFLIFRTRFAQKTVAEMVTLSKNRVNLWQVSGYSIQ